MYVCVCVCTFHVNELASPTDVKLADVQLHLRKFLHTQTNYYIALNCYTFTFIHPYSIPSKCIQFDGESCSY